MITVQFQKDALQKVIQVMAAFNQNQVDVATIRFKSGFQDEAMELLDRNAKVMKIMEQLVDNFVGKSVIVGGEDV